MSCWQLRPQPPLLTLTHWPAASHACAAVANLLRVLEATPQLQAVEVVGASPEAAGALLSAWQRVQEQRGRQGLTVPADGGGLRLARAEE